MLGIIDVNGIKKKKRDGSFSARIAQHTRYVDSPPLPCLAPPCCLHV